MKQNCLKRDWQGGFPDFRRVGVYLRAIRFQPVAMSQRTLGGERLLRVQAQPIRDADQPWRSLIRRPLL